MRFDRYLDMFDMYIDWSVIDIDVGLFNYMFYFDRVIELFKSSNRISIFSV